MENAQFLKGVSLFSELPENVLETLASRMLELAFPKGRHICKENDQGNALFVIKDGIVQIHVGEGSEKKVLAYLKRGDYFGEMALFTGEPRSASASALADVSVLGLMKDDLEREVVRTPAIALELLKTLSRRLAKANLLTGQGESKQGRLLFLAGSEKGAGKTVVARDLAAALAGLSDQRVVLLDPNVQNPSVARASGIQETCDLARELVSSNAVTVERYVKQTPWGYWVLLPQRVERTTYPLKESHHHVLMSALAEKFDYVVVDSSSTMAQFNKHLMQAASRILVVLSGRQDSLTSFLEPFQNLVLDKTGVDPGRVLYLLNQNAGEIEDPRGRLGRHATDLDLVLPHDPAALAATSERGGPATELAPDSPWAAAATELARTIFLEHSLEVLLPLAADGHAGASEDRARSEGERLTKEFEELFGEAPQVDRVTLDEASEAAGAPALEVAVRATQDRFNKGMDTFLQQVTSCRDRLGFERILVRIDGRPSLL